MHMLYRKAQDVAAAVCDEWADRRRHIANGSLYLPIVLLLLLFPVIGVMVAPLILGYIGLWAAVNLAFERQIREWINRGE